MTLDKMKQIKIEKGLSCERISRESGVPFGTVQKIFSGSTAHPRSTTLDKLSLMFKSTIDGDDLYPHAGVHPPLSVREPDPFALNTYTYENHDYPRQGEYTIDDYYALPDDQRVELVDGVFYDMGSPSPVHQLIAGEIYRQISNFISKNGGSCIPFIAPTDVQLDGLKDNRTMLEPDVFIVCNPDILNKKRIIGAPDFVLEVLSPSTRKYDMTTKLYKYTRAGVREYWIIDPDKGRVITYDLEHDAKIAIYTFKDLVPVQIYDGNLLIDFPGMPNYITRYYDAEGNPVDTE